MTKTIINANEFIKSRGPDKTNIVEWSLEKYKYIAIHNLDISGILLFSLLKISLK